MTDMKLNDVCYERIIDNYWYGIFGDFRLVIDQNTGYFNATKLCAMAGKCFRDWKHTKSAREFIEYYASNRFVDIATKRIMYKVHGNNQIEAAKRVTGTYVYERLFLAIAIWISKDFYDKCYQIILDYYAHDSMRLRQNNEELKMRINQIESKYRDIAAPYTLNRELENCLVVCKKNKKEEEKYPYYAIRVQRRNLKRSMKRAENKYPSLETVYEKKRDPNSVKLFQLMLEELPIKRKGNSFETKMDEEELVVAIDNLYERCLGECLGSVVPSSES